ncbi:hypothetical protein SteCoe_5366 [Stentor coeruleus]|uniref:Uncharacterized protein n=1 Tax=Stentor coeruleus TaxID=5963 RepID=A0A1R2CSG6_9CILI|nr:hypothetical protein SteCoe_5366 [Stentor coeruleus]
MTSAKISLLEGQDMIKLRNNLSYIPIQASEIKQSLDDYKEVLEYKSQFINKHHYNTSLSPESIEKKKSINNQAKKWQDDLTAIFKAKLKKKASNIIEKVKEQGEIESGVYDSIILRNLIQKMKIDEISRRISIETYRAKVQDFNKDKLKKKVEKEFNAKKLKEKDKASVWNKVQFFRRTSIDGHLPPRKQSISGFDFVTQIQDKQEVHM